jgi:hypothetical protein
MVVGDLFVFSSCKLSGASGLVKITAPFPGLENSEDP